MRIEKKFQGELPKMFQKIGRQWSIEIISHPDLALGAPRHPPSPTLSYRNHPDNRPPCLGDNHLFAS